MYIPLKANLIFMSKKIVIKHKVHINSCINNINNKHAMQNCFNKNDNKTSAVLKLLKK